MNRKRVQAYLEPEAYARFRMHCRKRGWTESAVLEEAILKALAGVDDFATMMRMLGRIERSLERIHRTASVALETMGLYVQYWFAHTPQVPDDAKSAAKRQAALRYAQFKEVLEDVLSSGRLLVHDLVHEPIADEAELAAGAASTASASAVHANGASS
jgi:hypothetical protein